VKTDFPAIRHVLDPRRRLPGHFGQENPACIVVYTDDLKILDCAAMRVEFTALGHGTTWFE
jgi:hypothetical protein